jgi:NADH-quinone oxidoreductase subunit M
MGMPGFSGFVAELQVLIGAWQSFPTLAVFSGAGILVGVAYTLRAIQKAFYSGAASAATEAMPQLAAGYSNGPVESASALEPRLRHPMETISIAERIGAVILIATTLAVGLYPALLLRLIQSGLESPLMSALTKGGPP